MKFYKECGKIADEWNKINPDAEKMRMVDVMCVKNKVNGNPNGEFFLVEEYINGVWEKWNANDGMIHPDFKEANV